MEDKKYDDTFSFSNSGSFSIAAENVTREKYESKFVELFDPVFVNLKINMPRKIEALFKSIDKINFLYQLVDTDSIEVVELTSKRVLVRIPVYDFQEFPFEALSKDLIFIVNREVCKSKWKAEQSRNYKEAVNKSTKFTIENRFKELKENYINFQLERKVNFVYIDSSEHLHAQLRSLITLQQVPPKFVPKTKKFQEGSREGFIRNILEAIPGVSQDISKAILEEYDCFEALERGLKSKEEFLSILIKEENGRSRSILEKVYQKIYTALKGTDPGARL
ncbi:hypothetical protein GINT2_002049 [Glugoides intestinalis]